MITLSDATLEAISEYAEVKDLQDNSENYEVTVEGNITLSGFISTYSEKSEGIHCRVFLSIEMTEARLSYGNFCSIWGLGEHELETVFKNVNEYVNLSAIQRKKFRRFCGNQDCWKNMALKSDRESIAAFIERQEKHYQSDAVLKDKAEALGVYNYMKECNYASEAARDELWDYLMIGERNPSMCKEYKNCIDHHMPSERLLFLISERFDEHQIREITDGWYYCIDAYQYANAYFTTSKMKKIKEVLINREIEKIPGAKNAYDVRAVKQYEERYAESPNIWVDSANGLLFVADNLVATYCTANGNITIDQTDRFSFRNI